MVREAMLLLNSKAGWLKRHVSLLHCLLGEARSMAIRVLMKYHDTATIVKRVQGGLALQLGLVGRQLYFASVAA